jgi:hypothetical protein
MAYTDIDKSDDYFNTVLYTGTGATNAITGVGFQPDFFWFKNRGGNYHVLGDSIRGITKFLYSNDTSAEVTNTTVIDSLDADGYTLGNNSNASEVVNISPNSMVSWNWLGGGAGVSNTDGSITSTVSANTTSGFSVVGWTGTGANGTIGHGLGTAPAMIIVKARGAVKDWMVGHNSLGWTKYINLNTTSASSTASTVWQDTTPDSDKFSVGSSSDVNTSSTTMIAYCFAEKKGFSKFGSYTGNGNADGTFVYTGFKPAFVMLKRTNDTAHWQMQDSKRIGFNPENERLYASDSAAEQTINFIDLLSNGFKCITTDAGANGSGDNFIYMAFAENPFVTSTSIPTTAR